MCGSSAPKWAAKWNQSRPIAEASKGPCNADGEKPTKSAPVEQWVEQLKGKRKQAKARMGAAGNAQSETTGQSRGSACVQADVTMVGDAAEEMISVEVDEEKPQISTLLAEISNLESVTDVNGVLANVIATKKSEIERIRREKRATKAPWVIQRDLHRKLERKQHSFDAVQVRRAKIESQMDQLRLELESVCHDALRIQTEIHSVQSEIAAEGARGALASLEPLERLRGCSGCSGDLRHLRHKESN